MARKPRLHFPGGFYHVMLRGIGGQDIFFAKADRKRFLERLAEGVARKITKNPALAERLEALNNTIMQA